VPQTFQKLRENTRDVPAVIANDFGLAERQSSVDVRFFHDDPELSSLVEVPYDRPSVVVPSHTMTGDTYCAHRGIGGIDLLKIDTEGSELLVLKGFEAMIASGGIDVVQFEYSRIDILSRLFLKDFYEFLGDSRYVIGKLFPNHVAFKPYDLLDETFMG